MQYVLSDNNLLPGEKVLYEKLRLRLSIIIPVYNEERTIIQILEKIRRVKLIQDIEKEVIIINDQSRDNSEKLILDYISTHPDLLIKYHSLTVNSGKGAAVHIGISQATGEFMLIQDADLEYDPYEYNMLLLPLVDGIADVVYGSRFIGGNPHRILFFWHTIGNKILTFIANFCANLNLTDMCTGYKVFKTHLVQKLTLKEKRFGFDPEITLKVAKIRHVKIYEVGISYYGRTYKEGKTINWKDGVRTIYCILKYGIVKRRISLANFTISKNKVASGSR
ncbi:glycosyltransferase family 2 protein [Chitinophaga sancti]|uniref:Glycosyl transferase family 2 n=1 Tax=Chitinophaga sancti TaxID=1004 RepID=A0A1K1T1X1_9BACT|nr:glycosyltransferase family 2 protein [Chitinophaga sancti]WQD59628.1 glycosyltransferase family 2 protein [Chitinophaga sancti]WQG88241.1 glycosyltransferase family 2 protein [Chitinophaga sancti]SFW90518.1 Glycosyl transferase family 2 [Chitinophaga sancti]